MSQPRQLYPDGPSRPEPNPSQRAQRPADSASPAAKQAAPRTGAQQPSPRAGTDAADGRRRMNPAQQAAPAQAKPTQVPPAPAQATPAQAKPAQAQTAAANPQRAASSAAPQAAARPQRSSAVQAPQGQAVPAQVQAAQANPAPAASTPEKAPKPHDAVYVTGAFKLTEKEPENGHTHFASVEDDIDHRVRRDRVFLNNPVMMQGLGLAPLIIAATTGRNALLLCVAVLLLLTPTRVLAALLCRFTHARFRGPVYALCSGVVYIGVYWVMIRLFQSADIAQLGLYLPLLVVDPIILKRYERAQNERVDTAARKGIITSLGYMLILMLVGCVREVLGLGTLFGSALLPVTPLPLLQLPVGGFLALALLMALWRSAVRVIKRSMAETEEDEWETE